MVLAAAALPPLLWGAAPARAQSTLPNQSCSGSDCTGLKPELTGCDQDAVTLRTGKVFDPSGRQVGTIELRSSARCQVNWARVTSLIGVQPLAATVTRDDGRAFGITFHGTSTWSPQVFVGTSGKANATGWIGTGSGSIADGPPSN